MRFGFELRPPIAESLERNPLRFAILSLIQHALLSRLNQNCQNAPVDAPRNLGWLAARFGLTSWSCENGFVRTTSSIVS